MQINITYDSGASGAPAGFQQAVQAAVDFLDSTIANNITVNITFGWGSVNDHAIASGAIGESSAYFYQNLSYSNVTTLLAGSPATPAAVAGLSALPATGPYGDTFVLPTAEAKALLPGLQYTGVDGYVGLDSSASFTFDPNSRAVAGEYDAIGVLEHEITEVLGRQVFAGQGQHLTPFDLFRYWQAGQHYYGQYGSSEFSLDGTNLLKAFNSNPNGDFGDWAMGGSADSLDAFATAGAAESFSTVDLRVLQALGYDLSPSAVGSPSAPLSITQNASLGGGASQSFSGAVGLVYSHSLTQAAISYANAGTISISGVLTDFDVVGVQMDASAGLSSGADLFHNTASGTVTVSATTAQSDAAGFFYGPAVTNDGHISVTSTQADAWALIGTTVTNGQTGALTVQASAGHATGIALPLVTSNASATNAGTLQVSAVNSGNVGAGVAYGVKSAGATNIVNSGVLTALSPSGAYGVQIDGGAINNTGSITTTASTNFAVATAVSDMFSSSASGVTLTNSGTVSATSGYEGIGFYLTNFAGGVLVNSGTISTTAAIGFGISIQSSYGGTVSIVNSGTIGGNSSIVTNDASTYSLNLNNAGSVTGQVFLPASSGATIRNTGSMADIYLNGGGSTTAAAAARSAESSTSAPRPRSTSATRARRSPETAQAP